MSQKSKSGFGNSEGEVFENWVSLTGQFFGDMAKVWRSKDAKDFTMDEIGEKTMEKLNEAYGATLKSWKAVVESIQNNEETILSEKNLEERAKVFEKIMESMAEGFQAMQDKGFEKAESIKESFNSFDFKRIDKDFFKSWDNFYQKEIAKILGMPQIGLGREYQEKVAEALDKFNLFNAAFIEFTYFLYLPMEKTFLVMQKDIEKMISQGKMPENSEELYNLWLQKLEAHYMAMFHSNEYAGVMGKTLESMAQFKTARDAVLEDMISTLPVPRKSEVDEMYKEIADLKRKLKKMEKEYSKFSKNL